MQYQRIEEKVDKETRTVAEAAIQLSFNLPVADELQYHFANADSLERGAVFTREEVVHFILDLAGYTSDKPLYTFRILEPSFGEGDFLTAIVHRLLSSTKNEGIDKSTMIDHLSTAVCAVEVHKESITRTKDQLAQMLRLHGFLDKEILFLLEKWIIRGDFLLVDLPFTFTHIVGNPPYVRQELIPDTLMAEYRSRYSTVYDRADLYIPFIERSITNLETNGVCVFICADRWTKNKYGGPLRQLIAENYHLKAYIDMVDTPAFSTDVIAYPAITVIRNAKPAPTRVAHRPELSQTNLTRVAAVINSTQLPEQNEVTEMTSVVNGREPWLLQSVDQVAIIRRLETVFPTLEVAGCTVGIGVATGADKIFIGKYAELPVEPSRKLPLVTTKDITTGKIDWQGLAVINPFHDDGTLVDLELFPELAAYLKRHESVIRKRNCAKNNQRNWYRTIDRIYPHLAAQPKLLIPDIKGNAHIVLEQGNYYPHHNLYYAISKEWDLQALQTVLRSSISYLFVSTYSTKMRGGYLRFQAQYLRRIRIPRWKDVPRPLQNKLISLSEEHNTALINDIVASLYDLSLAERNAIGV